MKDESKADFITRDAILKMLSADELAHVSNTEAKAGLADGEEYIDLEKLEQGVRRASTGAATMGRVLSRASVHKDTWNKILERLASTRQAHRTA